MKTWPTLPSTGTPPAARTLSSTDRVLRRS